MSGFLERRTNALIGANVERRNDDITQWNASDRWNRHDYSSDLNVAPGIQPPMLRATREFGLHQLDTATVVIDQAPDVSQYVIRNDGLLGHIFAHHK